MHITPKLRGTFLIGQEVRSLVIGTEKAGDEVALTLSLTSRKLVEKLFEEQGYSVRCTQRIAGVKSIVQSPQSLSRDSIKLVSNELKEYIIVEVTA
jgi:transcription antitermination factor NusA-like protein